MEWSKLEFNDSDYHISNEAESIYSEITRADLSGEPLYLGNKKNILLILLEGISGHHVNKPNELDIWQDNVSMPLLSASSKNAINFTHFIAPQVQTNRGLYSIICGNLPNLSAESAKMTMAGIVLKSEKIKCLPKILVEHGYATSYLQASGLHFMNKDKFMPLAGFERVNGIKWFAEPYFKHPWGVGDRDFFKQSVREIERLQEGEKPWFMTMLTVGTHHNYAIPEESKKEDMSPFANSVLHADSQLNIFLNTLDKIGIPDDTLIIISADESQGSKKDKTHLSKNWLPLVIFDKGVPNKKVNENFIQTDISLSIIDYLGLDLQEPFPGGRSIFRTYKDPRNLFFSRHQDNMIHWFSDTSSLLKCDRYFSTCETYQYSSPSFLWTPEDFAQPTSKDKKTNIARYVVEKNDWDFERIENDVAESTSSTRPWLGHYFMNSDLKGKYLTKAYDKINFKWSKNTVPYEGLPLYKFAARWQTCIKIEKDIELVATMSAKEGAELYINRQLTIDAWEKDSGKEIKSKITLSAGTHHIQMNYRNFYAQAYARLKLKAVDLETQSNSSTVIQYLPPVETSEDEYLRLTSAPASEETQEKNTTGKGGFSGAYCPEEASIQ